MPTNTATKIDEVEETVDRGDEIPRDEQGRFAAKPEVETKVDEVAPEASAEEAPVVEEEEGEAAPAKPVLIPKARYDFAAAKAKLAEKRAAELEAQLKELKETKPVTPEDLATKIADFDVQIENARKDGNADLVVQLTKQQRELERQYYAQPPVDTSKIVYEAVEANQVELMIDQLEATYEFLNPESESYDQAIVDEIMDLREALEGRGHSRTDALTRAAQYVLSPLLEPETPAPAKPAATGAPRKTDVARNLAAAKKLPPDLSNVQLSSDSMGLQNTVPDIFKMGEKEFNALDEKTLRRMRGDDI